MTLGHTMKTKWTITLPLLVCGLCALAQSDITFKILDTVDTNAMDVAIQAAQSNRFDNSGKCNITYSNPWNDIKVMNQWRVIDALFRTNNIRIGLMMCSLSCGARLPADDVERAKQILEKAIRDGRIDNAVLQMKIEAQPTAAAAARRER